MKTPGRLPAIVGMVISVVSWLAIVPAAPGAEPPAKKMLDGLREIQYYDMAILYLEKMRDRADCPPEFKEMIDYEIGATLLEAADATESASEREATLDQATEAIERFLKEHPTHEKAGAASTLIGRRLLLRGALRAQQAEIPGLSDEEKQAKLAEARDFFKQGQAALEGAENRLYAKAKELKDRAEADPSNRNKGRLREAYGELLQARLFLVNIADRKARTYAPDSKEFKEQLEAAAKRYEELFEKNEEQVGGLQARNFEGKIYADLNQNQKAIDIFREMLTLPGGEPAIRGLKRQATLWLMETLIKPDVKKADEAIQLAAEWKENALPNETTNTQGLQIQLQAGRACLDAAKALDPKDAKRRDLLRTARRYLELVQRTQGPLRKEANDLLTDEQFGAPEVVEAEPTTFEDAYEQAYMAWTRLRTTDGKMRRATDPAEKQSLSDQLTAAREATLKYSQLAVELADKKTDLAQLNAIRFFLTYLYFVDQRPYDAAVMGELLAYRYPQSQNATKGAEIAIKAYRTLFDAQRRAGGDTSFELAQMQRVAQYVTLRWPDNPSAQEAWLMLFDTAVDMKDIPKAKEYLEKLPPDSTRRAAAELRLGHLYWGQYLQQVALEEGERPSQEVLDELVRKAQESLRQGIDRMSKAVDAGGGVDYALAASVLALAQILIDAGDAAEAVRWLDDPKLGPMTLIAANDPSVSQRTDFKIEVYKTALRAYVGAEKLTEAETVMGKLEELVAQDDQGAARLTQIYISLGRQLEDLLTRLRAEGKTEEIQKVSQGFEKFLETISTREKGNSFSSLNWVAQTFASLAAGLDPGDGPLPPAALDYYKKAGATYFKLIDKPPADMPKGAETAIKVQLAICLRALGRNQDETDPKKRLENFKRALILLKGILEEREMRVDVQMEAARTYQEMARATKQPQFYLNAMLGGQKKANGSYLFWGWNGISRRVASVEKFRSVFFEARYNIALCRMRMAQTQSGEEQAKTLEKAANDIKITHKLYPSLGGEEWFDKFNALLKAIQKFQGVDNPQGLKGAE